MYIIGGTPVASTSPTTIPQTFMIDLSVSWSASEPVYKSLPDGPMGSATGALSSDGKSLLTLVNETGSIYDLQSGGWSSVLTNTNIRIFNGLAATTNPETGVIYVPNGYKSLDSNSMLAINLETETVDNIAMHPSLESEYFFSTAWSLEFKSMILIGGTTNDLFAYSPSMGWNDLTSIAQGDIPSQRYSPCLVPAFGGSKMVLFGGIHPSQNNTLNDIYLLDIPTMTWTRKPDTDLANGRGAAACSVSNGNFIAWGGTNILEGTASGPRDTLLVFDLISGTWTSEYNTSPDRLPKDTLRPMDNGTRLVAIFSGLCGVVVVLIAISVVMFCHYRTRNEKTSNSDNNDNEEKTIYLSSTASTAVDLSSIPTDPKRESYNDLRTILTPTPTPTLVPVYNNNSNNILTKPIARWAKTYSQELIRHESTSTLHESRYVQSQYPHLSFISNNSRISNNINSYRNSNNSNSDSSRNSNISKSSNSSSISGFSGKCSIFQEQNQDHNEDTLEYPREEYRLPVVRYGSVLFENPKDCYIFRANSCVSINE
ncbi:hypothetical protein BGX27_005358 [Mortierella sp. AM989]|nr:hypothetical protein BGX27_005358 [Mortierella sp. AM989]